MFGNLLKFVITYANQLFSSIAGLIYRTHQHYHCQWLHFRGV